MSKRTTDKHFHWILRRTKTDPIAYVELETEAKRARLSEKNLSNALFRLGAVDLDGSWHTGPCQGRGHDAECSAAQEALRMAGRIP